MEIKHLTDNDFGNETKNGLCLVDFFATWCGPCQILAPIIEDVQKDLENVKIFKVDVDENEKTAKNFGIMSIPTLVVLKDGEEVNRYIGLLNRDTLIEWVNSQK